MSSTSRLSAATKASARSTPNKIEEAANEAKSALPEDATRKQILARELIVLQAECKKRGINYLNRPKHDIQDELCDVFEQLNKAVGDQGVPSHATAPPALTLSDLEQVMQKQLAGPLAALAGMEARFTELTGMTTALQATQAEMAVLKVENQKLHRVVEYLDNQVGEMKATSNNLTAKLNRAADQPQVALRQNNLCLTRLPKMDSQADAESSVKELLQTLQVSSQLTGIKLWKPSTVVATTSRTTEGPAWKGRVLVSFADEQAKKRSFTNAHKLKGTAFERTHLDDDLTPMQQQARKDQQPLYKQLWQEGKRPRWKGAQLMVAGAPYNAALAQPKRPAAPPAASPVFSHPSSFQVLA